MMTEQNRQFDDLERQVSDRFRSDLHGLFEPAGAVPPQVDKAILEQARRRLTKPRPLILRLRWAGGLAAAAAVIALGVFLYHGPGSSNHPSSINNHQSAAAQRRADLDGNGRVDILDAFRLARHIESRGPAQPDWDINRDGRIDREDVDAIAAAAVRLRPVSVGCVPRTTTEQERWCVIPLLSEGEPAPDLIGGALPAGLVPTRRAMFPASLDEGV